MFKSSGPTLNDLFEKFAPLLASFSNIMKGAKCDNIERVEEWKHQLIEICALPFTSGTDLPNSFFIDTMEKEYPHINSMCRCLYMPFINGLGDKERNLLSSAYPLGMTGKFDCYKLLMMTREMMLHEKYYTLVLKDNVYDVKKAS